MKELHKTILKFVLLIAFLTLGVILLINPITGFLSNLEGTRNFINEAKILGPLIFIFIIVLQVLFAPIPGQAAGFAGGYLFGIFFGTLYSMIGLIIGSFIAFYLGRKLGRPFVEKVVKKETLKKFDHIILKNGVFTLFLIYLLPIFPDDAICYIAGLTKIKIKTLVIISAIGRLPGFIVLSMVGAGFASENSTFSIILLGAIIVISFIIYLNKARLEKLMIKFVNKLKCRN